MFLTQAANVKGYNWIFLDMYANYDNISCGFHCGETRCAFPLKVYVAHLRCEQLDGFLLHSHQIWMDN